MTMPHTDVWCFSDVTSNKLSQLSSAEESSCKTDSFQVTNSNFRGNSCR